MMDKNGSAHMEEPFRTLKQMSIKRQDLEKSSMKLTSDLEELQQINEEQDERISNSLSALQKEQQKTEQLLQQSSSWVNAEDNQTQQAQSQRRGYPSPSENSLSRTKVQREPSVIRKLRQWSTSDVIQWLENRKLHKFILLFQRHHVTGTDLAEANLFFLESYDHISTVDRELLLAEVYNLLSLEISDDDDLTRITTPVEREKYRAARQMTKDVEQKYCRSQSLPVVYLPNHSSPSSSSPSSAASSPTPKLRKKSEPSPESPRVLGKLVQRPGLLDIETNKAKCQGPTSSRKYLPEKLKSKSGKSGYGSSLFAALRGHSHPSVRCCVLYKENGQFNLSVGIRQDGHLVVESVAPDQAVPVSVADRILEINGFSCLISQKIQKIPVDDIFRGSETLQLVIYTDVRSHMPPPNLSSEDLRWDRLRNFLIEMKDQDVDVGDIVKSISADDLKEIKQQVSLQDELNEARIQISDQQELIDKLQKDLDLQRSDLQEMTRQRDTAVKETSKSKVHKLANTTHGETEYYKITMESLNIESASKERVVESLKEIVKEASKQKFYLDRLISVVIEEVPWILEQVDADFDNTSFSETVVIASPDYQELLSKHALIRGNSCHSMA